MKSNPITQIYFDFRSAFDNNPDNTIDFYKKNALILNNITGFNNKEELKYYIELTNKYAEALSNKKRYNLLIDHLNDKLPLIDAELLRLNAIEEKDDWYYFILFLKGAAFYYLKRYRQSHIIFRDLSEHDPDNDQYKMWLRYADYGINKWLLMVIGGVSILLIFSKLTLRWLIPSPAIISLLSNIGAIGSFGVLACEFYLKRSFRKTSK